ncbi:MAG: 1-deoxy-D-xylulose-5-phosphate reductoisomerase [Candidatus Aureabacteria bacterium]|nr:1-deoxy-D-xylulose-5-phosphate reductoisomerase [Candidatus Auribacterota bacterium]
MKENPKKVVILGSTGSIGTNALSVIRSDPRSFRVVGLAAGRNVALLQRQAAEFRPKRLVVESESAARRLKAEMGGAVSVKWGQTALEELAALPEAAIVVSAIPGIAGLLPTLAAIRAGKTVALAAKEVLVAAGAIVMEESRAKGNRLIPVDSEHSAVFQCLRGEDPARIRRIILTASGGPFLNRPKSSFRRITPEEALQHPRWKMGRKVTLDSATLMNKGLEVLEAHYLFGVPFDRIQVVVHPESIVHALVEMSDGAVLAQMSRPDMRLPIQYALGYPERAAAPLAELDFCRLPPLTFREPDWSRFPALGLAYEAGKVGGTMPAVLNAANEEAGTAFLERRLLFSRIMPVVEEVMGKHQVSPRPQLGEILAADRWAREEARGIIASGASRRGR